MNAAMLAWPWLTAAVALLPGERSRRLGGVGLVGLGLGLAARQASGPSGPPGFLAINGGLMLLGALTVGVAFAGAWRDRQEPRRQREIRAPEFNYLMGARLSGYAVGTGAAAVGPHVAAVFGGAALAAWCGWGLRRGPEGTVRLPVAPALVTGLLLAAYWFLATIAGPEGLALSAVPSLPLSPAAERLLALVLLLLMWLLAGLPPFHSQGLGTLTAPLALALLVRVALPATPSGLEHWQPAAFPVVAIGVWVAAAKQRLSLLAIAGAMLGLASLDRHAILGAAALLGSAVGLELCDSWKGERQGWVPAMAVAAAAAGAGWGSLAVATGGLRAEVVYTVLAAAGAALGLSRRRPHSTAGGAHPRT